MRKSRIAAILALFAPVSIAGTPVSAQSAEATCPATPAPLPAELAGWRDATPVVALVDARGPGTAIALDRAVDATLHPGGKVAFVVAPTKPIGETKGGLLRFDAPADGTYRIALGVGAWIDVIEDGKTVTSTAHGHGPACSGIRKMVDFPLKRGAHLLQIIGSPEATVRVMISSAR
jgi:hypothetical protein